ncbi:TPA: rRNA pseudouridine synthase, partial [Streptococcus agalactiae]|nr:rRNA pseudouridine synthase [Streptococcus agalactiae]
MRLDKFLVECGLGSRTQVKLILKKKQISVNGNSETSPKVQVDEYRDEIKYNGTLVSYEKFVYYMLHKPKGVISATDDPSHKTVLDLLDKTARDKAVFPVGRLD